MLGLLLDADAAAGVVKFHHAVALRVVNAITEDGGFGFFLGHTHGLVEHAAHTRAVENVVA